MMRGNILDGLQTLGCQFSVGSGRPLLLVWLAVEISRCVSSCEVLFLGFNVPVRAGEKEEETVHSKGLLQVWQEARNCRYQLFLKLPYMFTII